MSQKHNAVLVELIQCLEGGEKKDVLAKMNSPLHYDE